VNAERLIGEYERFTGRRFNVEHFFENSHRFVGSFASFRLSWSSRTVSRGVVERVKVLRFERMLYSLGDPCSLQEVTNIL
jgi:hypothetical protein